VLGSASEPGSEPGSEHRFNDLVSQDLREDGDGSSSDRSTHPVTASAGIQ